MVASTVEVENPQGKPIPARANKTLPQAFVNPAGSLAQADRHLTARPFGILGASDFVLGPLFSDTEEPAEIASVKNIFIDAIIKKTLPLDSLSPAAKEITPFLLNSTLKNSPDIVEVRISAIQDTPDENKSFKFCLYTQTGRTEGLVILAKSEGAWIIEHISLDSEALRLPYARIKDFDPYGVLVSPR